MREEGVTVDFFIFSKLKLKTLLYKKPLTFKAVNGNLVYLHLQLTPLKFRNH